MKEALKDEGIPRILSSLVFLVSQKYTEGRFKYERTAPYFVWHFRLNKPITD
ncbi:hypothetical protein [Bacillus sp. FSL K6-1003]|uniref:hypothetical protein n=1 Tax=Bacillus sp. FSL K6-1003 TaxID=2954675 RepID=UPI0030CDA11E